MQDGGAKTPVLLAEDESITALELEESLRMAGFEIVGPFSTCAAAEQWLEGDGRPNAAILDNMLSDGPCDQLVLNLSIRNIPVIIYSGMPSRDIVASARGQARILAKPAPFETIVDALQRVLARGVACPNGATSRSSSFSAIP